MIAAKVIDPKADQNRLLILGHHARVWCQKRRDQGLPVEYNALATYLQKSVAQDNWEILLEYSRKFTILFFIGESRRSRKFRKAAYGG